MWGWDTQCKEIGCQQTVTEDSPKMKSGGEWGSWKIHKNVWHVSSKQQLHFSWWAYFQLWKKRYWSRSLLLVCNVANNTCCHEKLYSKVLCNPSCGFVTILWTKESRSSVLNTLLELHQGCLNQYVNTNMNMQYLYNKRFKKNFKKPGLTKTTLVVYKIDNPTHSHSFWPSKSQMQMVNDPLTCFRYSPAVSFFSDHIPFNENHVVNYGYKTVCLGWRFQDLATMTLSSSFGGL